MRSGCERIVRLVATTALVCALSACKVVPIEQDRAMRAQRSGEFDPATFVKQAWSGQFAQDLDDSAQALDKIVPQLRQDFDRTAGQFGLRGSDGAPWTFVVKGEGVVTATDFASRTGSFEVTLDGGQSVRILIGPVLVSTAVRDALPSLRFDDYPDQMVFAAVNKELNSVALAESSRTARMLVPGRRVRFSGVLQLAGPSLPVEILPFSLLAGAEDR